MKHTTKRLDSVTWLYRGHTIRLHNNTSFGNAKRYSYFDVSAFRLSYASTMKDCKKYIDKEIDGNTKGAL